jgi:hypothetical protein
MGEERRAPLDQEFDAVLLLGQPRRIDIHVGVAAGGRHLNSGCVFSRGHHSLPTRLYPSRPLALCLSGVCGFAGQGLLIFISRRRTPIP